MISDLESPSNFQVKVKKLFKSVHKQEIGLLWSSESFEGEYNIRFGNPIEFLSQSKKNYSNLSINKKLDFFGPVSHLRESKILDLESPSNFKVKEKIYSNRSINKKLNFFGPVSHLRESTISDFESPSNFIVNIFFYWNRSRNNEIMLWLKMQNSSCLKLTYRLPDID